MIGILFLQAWLEDTRRPTLKYVTAYVFSKNCIRVLVSKVKQWGGWSSCTPTRSSWTNDTSTDVCCEDRTLAGNLIQQQTVRIANLILMTRNRRHRLTSSSDFEQQWLLKLFTFIATLLIELLCCGCNVFCSYARILKKQNTYAMYPRALLTGLNFDSVGGATARPGRSRCTKRNSPPVNGQCTNFILFDVAL